MIICLNHKFSSHFTLQETGIKVLRLSFFFLYQSEWLIQMWLLFDKLNLREEYPKFSTWMLLYLDQWSIFNQSNWTKDNWHRPIRFSLYLWLDFLVFPQLTKMNDANHGSQPFSQSAGTHNPSYNCNCSAQWILNTKCFLTSENA